MGCNTYQEALLEALAESRSVALGEEIETHLRTCPSCREEFLAASRALELVRETSVPDPDPRFWVNFLPNVRRKIAEAEERRRIWWWNWVPVPLLGTLAVGVLVMAVMFSNPPSPPFTKGGMGGLIDPETEAAFPLQPGWEDLAKESRLLLSDLVPAEQVERDLLAKLVPTEVASALPQMEEAMAFHLPSGISTGYSAYEQAHTFFEEATEHERALLLARIGEG